jgi:hypothetical protein
MKYFHWTVFYRNNRQQWGLINFVEKFQLDPSCCKCNEYLYTRTSRDAYLK